MTTTVTMLNSSQTYINLLPSASRTTTPSSQEVDIKLTGLGGIIFIVNVTVAPGAGKNITAKIEGVDPYSEYAWPILTATTTAIVNTTNGTAGVGTYVYKVHPAAPPLTTGVVQHAQDVVPPRVRLTLTHDAGATATYSVSMLTDGD